MNDTIYLTGWMISGFFFGWILTGFFSGIIRVDMPTAFYIGLGLIGAFIAASTILH